MNFQEASLQLSQSTALRLLRAENAPLVLCVLHSAFKREHVPVVRESRLRAILEAELEELRDAGLGAEKKGSREYLLDWTDAAHGYLRRHHPDGEEEPVCELTPEAELVFQWLEDLKPQSHVGTESTFRRLAAMLADIVENAGTDPEVRIERLRAEQARVERQIEEIRTTGVVPAYSPTQINERFAAALAVARQLLGDFRQVERHFRGETEAIIALQAEPKTTRGAIVGQTLDAQEQLRESSQGQSFYAFWEFLLSQDQRARFSQMLEQAYALPNLAPELRADSILRRLQASLSIEGSKVLASNERLIAQMRRLLDVREAIERREVGRLLGEIKTLLRETREAPASEELLEIDVVPPLSSLMSKLPWSPSTRIFFGDTPELSEGADIEEALRAFLRQHPIDFERLRGNIRECLATRVQITLSDLLGEFPPRNGILEVLAYVHIAESDGSHAVWEDTFDVIELTQDPRQRYRVPQVVFSNA